MKHVFESNGVRITIYAAANEESALRMLKDKLLDLKESQGVELPDFLTFKLVK